MKGRKGRKGKKRMKGWKELKEKENLLRRKNRKCLKKGELKELY